jgi:hypothetical protein
MKRPMKQQAAAEKEHRWEVCMMARRKTCLPTMRQRNPGSWDVKGSLRRFAPLTSHEPGTTQEIRME